MNILFLMKNFAIGGIEVVSTVLANSFIEHGHKCAFFTFKEPSPMMREKVPPQAKIFVKKGLRVSKKSISALRKVLIDEKIDVIINQWGLPYAPTLIAQLARRGLHVKYISVYHNSPDTNARIQEVLIAKQKTNNKWNMWRLKAKLQIVKLITQCSMRYVYNQSDYYVLLSPSFIDKFCTFCHLDKEPKLITITNPLTLPEDKCIYREELKRKQVVYMGRIDNNQKRVYRIIDVWERLNKRFPDWSLSFVGDGPERPIIEKMVVEKGLTNVQFEGFAHPEPYYETASILIQTSEYEGVPLVLAEAMCFGVVPVVYGSYSAVYDIIEHEKNGLICSYSPSGFNPDSMVSLLAQIMEDPEKLHRMAILAAQTKSQFSIKEIYKKWLPFIEGE